MSRTTETLKDLKTFPNVTKCQMAGATLYGRNFCVFPLQVGTRCPRFAPVRRVLAHVGPGSRAVGRRRGPSGRGRRRSWGREYMRRATGKEVRGGDNACAARREEDLPAGGAGVDGVVAVQVAAHGVVEVLEVAAECAVARWWARHPNCVERVLERANVWANMAQPCLENA